MFNNNTSLKEKPALKIVWPFEVFIGAPQSCGLLSPPLNDTMYIDWSLAKIDVENDSESFNERNFLD